MLIQKNTFLIKETNFLIIQNIEIF